MKPGNISARPRARASLPSRERELKQRWHAQGLIVTASLPSRERELKQAGDWREWEFPMVAPLAGARIETRQANSPPNSTPVAPLAGARIETDTRAQAEAYAGGSLPSRERELKLALPMILGD